LIAAKRRVINQFGGSKELKNRNISKGKSVLLLFISFFANDVAELLSNAGLGPERMRQIPYFEE